MSPWGKSEFRRGVRVLYSRLGGPLRDEVSGGLEALYVDGGHCGEVEEQYGTLIVGWELYGGAGGSVGSWGHCRSESTVGVWRTC